MNMKSYFLDDGSKDGSWLNNKAQAEFVLDRLSSENLNSSILALQMKGDKTFPSLPEQLDSFPLGYRYCGTVIYPHKHQNIQIWQYQAI